MILKVSNSFADFAQQWLELYAKPHKRTWTEDEGRIRLYMIPAWGERPVDSITRGDVAKLHTEIGKTKPYQANRLLENVSKMYACASDWGFVPTDYPNPAKGVKPFRENDRLRFLTEKEAKRLVECIQAEDEYTRAAILLLLLTGLRKTAILKLRWENVNFDEGWIKVTDKNDATIFQPLSSPAKAVLASLPRHISNPYVIVGAKPGKPRYTIQKAWERVRRHANLTDVHIHDLRRTVGSWLTASGAPLQVVKEVLNHSDIKTTLVYARVPSALKRDALDGHGERLKRLIGE